MLILCHCTLLRAKDSVLPKVSVKMMSVRIRRMFVYLLAGWPLIGMAFEMQELKDFHAAGNAESAYRYAQPHASSMAGDPTFDYYYGIAAVNSGHSSEGVFALERVLAAYPDNLSARMALAKGYAALDNPSRARAELQTVLDANPPANVVAAVERRLHSLQHQSTASKANSSAYFELGVGHSNNINNAPENDAIGGLTINDRARSDSYSALAAGYRLDVPIATGRSFFAGANADYRANADKTRFNAGDIDLFAGFGIDNDADRYQFRIQASNYYLDDDEFRESISLHGDWQRRTSKSQRVNVFALLSSFEYPSIPNRDATSLTLGAGVLRALQSEGSMTLFGTAFAGRDDADTDTVEARSIAERAFVGAHLGLQLQTSLSTRWVNSASILANRYAEERAIPNQTDRKREDDLYSLNSELIWSLSRQLSVHGQLTYTENNANIDEFEYDGLSGDVRIRYSID